MINFFQIIVKLLKWNIKLLSFLREFCTNAILVTLIIIIMKIWLQYKQTTKISLNSYKALNINIKGFIVDTFKSHNSYNFINYLTSFENNHYGNISVFDIVDKIRTAKKDKYITGIILNLTELQDSELNLLDYIGKSIKEFRNSGKKVYAIGNNYSQVQYYLSSFADKIFIYPYGKVELHGFSNQEFFFKPLLKKLKIKTEIFRIGKYKSAVEPFFKKNMSKETKQIKMHLITDKWNYYLNNLSKNRKSIPLEIFPNSKTTIQDLKKLDGDNALFAKYHQLVDEIISKNQLKQKFIKIFGLNHAKNDFNQISIYNYANNKIRQNYMTNNTIAVILANGSIVPNNKSDNQNYINSNLINKQIQKIIENPDIKALVIRLNSPGGEVGESEVIREKLEELKSSGKPIVISMGDIATSGAYYIATAGNYIIADPMTLTGSIGIFGIFNNIYQSLKLIGININQIDTSPFYYNILTKTMTKELKTIIKINMLHEYNQFIKIVSHSRKKTPLEIKKIAEGRIWNGIQAKNIGLIDALGDFDDALNKASELSKIKNYNVLWMENQTELFNFSRNPFLMHNTNHLFNSFTNILIHPDLHQLNNKFAYDFIKENYSNIFFDVLYLIYQIISYHTEINY